MENETYNQSAPENVQPEQELTHSDKIIGVFTSPEETFESISKFRVKTIDWLLPLLVMCIVTAGSFYVKLQNPLVRQTYTEKMNQSFEKSIAEKKITQEQADKSIESMKKIYDSSVGQLLMSFSSIFGVIIFFFIYAAIVYVAARFILGGKGSYMASLPAVGLALYISLFSMIVGTIFTTFYNVQINDANLGSLFNLDPKSMIFKILFFIDLVAIWAVYVQSIGLKKLYHLNSNIPIFIAVLVLYFATRLLGLIYT